MNRIVAVTPYGRPEGAVQHAWEVDLSSVVIMQYADVFAVESACNVYLIFDGGGSFTLYMHKSEYPRLLAHWRALKEQAEP